MDTNGTKIRLRAVAKRRRKPTETVLILVPFGTDTFGLLTLKAKLL
jgi:hypothetical protein